MSRLIIGTVAPDLPIRRGSGIGAYFKGGKKKKRDELISKIGLLQDEMRRIEAQIAREQRPQLKAMLRTNLRLVKDALFDLMGEMAGSGVSSSKIAPSQESPRPADPRAAEELEEMSDLSMSESPRSESARSESARSESARSESARSESARSESSRSEDASVYLDRVHLPLDFEKFLKEEEEEEARRAQIQPLEEAPLSARSNDSNSTVRERMRRWNRPSRQPQQLIPFFFPH